METQKYYQQIHTIITTQRKKRYITKILVWKTRSSAIAERPRDALYQLKSCQLLHSCTKNHIWKGLQWVNDLEGN